MYVHTYMHTYIHASNSFVLSVVRTEEDHWKVSLLYVLYVHTYNTYMPCITLKEGAIATVQLWVNICSFPITTGTRLSLIAKMIGTEGTGEGKRNPREEYTSFFFFFFFGD